jgi:hypothetical protein
MAIDMGSLKAMSQGNPDDKITVRREWLAEVYTLLSEKEDQRNESLFDRIFGKGFFRNMSNIDKATSHISPKKYL